MADRKHVQRFDGEGWEIRNREKFRISCCDCGLTHDFVIVAPKLRKGSIIGIAATRNRKATAAKRRGNG